MYLTTQEYVKSYVILSEEATSYMYICTHPITLAVEPNTAHRTDLNIANFGRDGIVSLRHGKLGVDPIVVSPTQLAPHRAEHFHRGQVYLCMNNTQE